MAKYKAVKSFGGIVSMHAGEVKEISNADVAKDLLKAGYIVECKPADKGKPKNEMEQPAKGKTKRG
jgi:hypothetical protein